MSVCYECCVLSGRGLYEELIPRTEESYQLWCVVVCDLETSRMRRLWPTGAVAPKTNETCKFWDRITWTKVAQVTASISNRKPTYGQRVKLAECVGQYTSYRLQL
jgi:hypothetical protein